ncbi:MAG: permease, partial [Actinobacteria bacterium]|nr:permease [Actinomycetota bacterium]
YVGEGSGIKGIIIVFIIGSVAAGPLYAAFPVAAVLMKKGAKFSNVLIFIGAWSTTKIPMFLFEMSSMGAKFAITRLLIDIPGIIIIAYAIYFMISKKEREKIYSLDEKNPGTI